MQPPSNKKSHRESQLYNDQLLTNRKNCRFRGDVYFSSFDKIHLKTTGKNTKAWKDCLKFVNYKTRKPDTLSPLAMSGENRMNVPGKNEFPFVVFNFWVMRENKKIFFKIIDVNLQIGFKKLAHR